MIHLAQKPPAGVIEIEIEIGIGIEKIAIQHETLNPIGSPQCPVDSWEGLSRQGKSFFVPVILRGIRTASILS
jgi:hypothetical protein